MAEFSNYQPHANIQVQVLKEDLSLYQGQSFWIAFQVKMPYGTRLGWHQPIEKSTPTILRAEFVKPFVVTQWMWQMPHVKWNQEDVEVYYQDQFTVLAQVQWSGPVTGSSYLNSPQNKGKWFLEGQTQFSNAIEIVKLQGEFALPTLRLPNQVPMAQDPLTVAEFTRIFHNMPQRLDPALVDWKIDGQKVHMILRHAINRSFRWAVIPSNSRVEVSKSASLKVAIAEQRASGNDTKLVFDNDLRKQWLDAGVDEVMIVDEHSHQAFVVALKSESSSLITWLEKMSKWCGFGSKKDQISL
jgi:hypothetical protein